MRANFNKSELNLQGEVYNLVEMVERYRRYFQHIEAERKRQIALRKKVGFAYEALRPVLQQLSSGPVTWEDSDSYFADNLMDISANNPFVVPRNPDLTYQKALKFLLERKGNDLYSISTKLLTEGETDKHGYDEAIAKIYGVLQEKLNNPNL